MKIERYGEHPVTRYTPEEYFRGIRSMMEEDGALADPDGILDYTCAVPNDRALITDHDFTVSVSIDYGGSEGAYADVMMEGVWEEGREKDARVRIGGAKTLRTDLEAMRFLGEIAGAFRWYAQRFMSEHWDSFLTREALERKYTCKAEKA